MSTPYDRMAYLRQCEAEASAKVAQDTSPQDHRTHQDEMLIAHQCSTVANTPASGAGHYVARQPI